MKVRVRIWDRVDNGQDLWVWVAERFICDKTQILFRVNLVSYLVSLATHQYNTSIFLDFCMVSLTLFSQWQGVIFSAPALLWTWSEVSFSLFVRIKKQYISAAVQCAGGCSLLTNKIYVTVNKLTISQSHFYNFSPSSESWKLHRLTQRKFNCGERAAMWSKNANSLS